VPVLTLEEYPVPKVCLREGKTGRPGELPHLTDDLQRTLCGLRGGLSVVEGARPSDLTEVNQACRKCLQAVDGEARTRRFT
jgi:hypothetical protein